MTAVSGSILIRKKRATLSTGSKLPRESVWDAEPSSCLYASTARRLVSRAEMAKHHD